MVHVTTTTPPSLPPLQPWEIGDRAAGNGRLVSVLHSFTLDNDPIQFLDDLLEGVNKLAFRGKRNEKGRGGALHPREPVVSSHPYPQERW